MDRRLSDLESNFAVLQRQEGAAQRTNGVEVANSWRSDGDKSNRSSIYTSQSSMTGSELPYSSSHIPGYTSTDESSTNRVNNGCMKWIMNGCINLLHTIGWFRWI